MDNSRVTKLPAATREEQLRRHGLSASHRWSEAQRRPRHAVEPDVREDDTEDDGSALAFLLGEDGHGAVIVDTSRGRGARTTLGARDAGMTSHRGIVQRGEYVDIEELARAVEIELGFTRADFAQVSSSNGGRPRKDIEELARRVNARLAELHAQGSNFAVLAQVLGVTPQALGERARKANRL